MSIDRLLLLRYDGEHDAYEVRPLTDEARAAMTAVLEVPNDRVAVTVARADLGDVLERWAAVQRGYGSGLAPHCGRLCARQAGHADLRFSPGA